MACMSGVIANHSTSMPQGHAMGAVGRHDEVRTQTSFTPRCASTACRDRRPIVRRLVRPNVFWTVCSTALGTGDTSSSIACHGSLACDHRRFERRLDKPHGSRRQHLYHSPTYAGEPPRQATVPSLDCLFCNAGRSQSSQRAAALRRASRCLLEGCVVAHNGERNMRSHMRARHCRREPECTAVYLAASHASGHSGCRQGTPWAPPAGRSALASLRTGSSWTNRPPL